MTAFTYMKNMKRWYLLVWIWGICISGRGQSLYEEQVLDIGFVNDTTTYCFVSDTNIYTQGWIHLQQVKFWRMIMNLSPEYSLLNVAETREIITSLSTLSYDTLSITERRMYKDSIMTAMGIPDEYKLYVTQGRSDYYQIQRILPDIHKAISIFLSEGTDPWYAQAILLIESPGEMRVSPVGAKGPFQLMSDIARSEGLIVTEELDQRVYFEPSARGAARFIKGVCLPAARSILDRHEITYREDELWFRLFVLHIYHAGPRTISRLLRDLRPVYGGIQLIQRMWQNSYGRFGNASQNYSQIALAAMLELEQIIYDRGGFFIPSR